MEVRELFGKSPGKALRGKPAFPALSFSARIFAALVGISATTSLVVGLVLYYFAENRFVAAEGDLLIQRSRTANAEARQFLESLRNPEDGTLPPPEIYARELVRSVSSPTGLGVLYLSPDGTPLVAQNGERQNINPTQRYEQLGLSEETVDEASASTSGEGQLIPRPAGRGSPRYIAIWPLVGIEGEVRGIIVYTASQEGLDRTLAFLRFGILGAIAASIFLAGAGSLLLARQITRPLSDMRDAAIRVASGDYSSITNSAIVKSEDELGEVARSFNYMASEIERYVSEIQEQKARLETVLDASPEAIVATDPEGRISMSNPAAARILGVTARDYRCKPEELSMPQAVLECLKEAIGTGAAVRELEIEEKAYWAYAARMDPRGLAGEVGAILAVRDITEHRSLEQSKTAFVSDVSHELRTPLTTIQSALDLISRGRKRLDPLEHRALELADQELKRIRGMVEELLTLAQMDSRQYALELGVVDLSEVVENSVESIESKAQRFGTEINIENSGEHRCLCDARKLYQVLLNLLDNAVKYSDPGSRVDISIFEDEKHVTVRIKDTGVGIPPEDLPQLFERFYRVDKARSRITGGTGLGLAISKEIVDLHGGELVVESEVGFGSTFDVRLPKSSIPRSANYAL